MNWRGFEPSGRAWQPARSWTPQQINWGNPWQIPEEQRFKWLPGRMLRPEEQARYMPTRTPFESYEQGARASWGLHSQNAPAAWFATPTQAAALREQAFEQANVPLATREELRKAPLFALNPPRPWGSGYKPAPYSAGQWQGWDVVSQTPYVTAEALKPPLAVHEYAHAWEYPQRPFLANEMAYKAWPYISAVQDKANRGIPLSVVEQALLGADGAARWQAEFFEDEGRYAGEFYAALAEILGGDVSGLPQELRDYYRGLYWGE